MKSRRLKVELVVNLFIRLFDGDVIFRAKAGSVRSKNYVRFADNDARPENDINTNKRKQLKLSRKGVRKRASEEEKNTR